MATLPWRIGRATAKRPARTSPAPPPRTGRRARAPRQVWGCRPLGRRALRGKSTAPRSRRGAPFVENPVLSRPFRWGRTAAITLTCRLHPVSVRSEALVRRRTCAKCASPDPESVKPRLECVLEWDFGPWPVDDGVETPPETR